MNKITSDKYTRFSKLKVGDTFRVPRESDKDVYEKHDSFVTLLGTKISFRPFHGCTIVEKIEL